MRINSLTTRCIALLTLLILCATPSALAQEEIKSVSQSRIGMEMDWKLFNVKGLKFSLAPEFRLDEEFSLERFQVETAIRYKTFDFLYWGASYRLNIEPTDQMMQSDKFGQYSLSLNAKKEFFRFTPSLRARYSNYTDSDTDNERYMRYRAKLDYNIDHFPLDPYISAELFQPLDSSESFDKVRYSAGVEYKIKKNNYLCLNYKLDYYLLKYKNRHIFSLGYKVSF